MDIFNKKYKNSLDKNIYDFIFFLSTDEKLYDDILKNFNTNENMKFCKRKDDYLYNLYIMKIIESIFEDVEFMNDNNNKFKENKVYESDYYLYKPENNIDLKNKFVIEFLKNNYSDLIEYSIKNLEDINQMQKEKIEMKSRYIAIKLYEKNIKFINRIYNYYNSFNFENKLEEIIPLKNSLKEFIERNNLSKAINEQTKYKDIFFQLLEFLNLFYVKEEKSQDIVDGLIDNCFYLFISLLFKNKDAFQDIKNNIEKEEILKNVLKFIISSESQKHKRYIIFLSKINTYPEEIHLYLIDLSFQVLIEKGDKKFLKLGLFYISKNLWSNGINKKNIKEKIKEQIISKFYKCLTDNSENLKLNAFMQVLLKLLENQKQLTNELIEGKYNNKKIYDLIYEKIYKLEEKKLKEKFGEYENFKNILLSEKYKDKFILYDDIKKLIEEIFNSNKINDKNNAKDNEQNKNIIDFLISCFHSYNSNNPIQKTMIGRLITSLKNLINEETKEYNNNIKNQENNKMKKKTTPYVGLKNLGTLCYINSIIQQLFFIQKFKYSILSANDSKPPDKSFEFTDDDNILHQTQKLFTYLSFSSLGEFEPKYFIFSIKYLGERIELNNMLDSNEFLLNFLEQISTCLENTEYKNIINDLFGGKIKEKKICSECGNTSYKEDEFKLITLKVKEMRDIFQSFENYISEEIIEGYKCENCNKKVNLKKSNIILDLPNILVIHLNRMIYNNNTGEFEKMNSKLDFPLELDMKKYCIQNNLHNEDYYKYQLRGINIHKGTAKAGHYISLIQTSKEEKKWFLFDDSFVSEYNFNNFEDEFNNNESNNSAYILFYEAIQEKQMKSEIKKYIPKEYLIEVFNNNKVYDLLYGNKVIDINNELIKIFFQIIDDQSFRLKDKNLSIYDIRDLIDIFTELIINYYSNEDYIKKKDTKNVKSLINIINKIFLSAIKDEDNLPSSDKVLICKHIIEKLLSDKNLKIIFKSNEMEEINKVIYDLIHEIIIKSKTDNIINSKDELQEKLCSIINKEKNISIYLYKILYELVADDQDYHLSKTDINTFLDLLYKIDNENSENLKEINKIFDYYLNKKNIFEKSENVNKVLKECSNSNFFKLLFDEENKSLIKIIQNIQYNDEAASNKFNMEIIQKLYIHCLKEKENDKIRQKQIKLMKLIFSILDIKDTFVLKRIKLLLGFPTLVMISSNDIISKFGINLLNNDINKEIYEYCNYNFMKKDNCVLSYLFPSCYNKNDENKLEEEDKCDLIYELIKRCFGLNDKKEGNYFLFKTLYLMQSRSIKFENLYQEMKYILNKAKYNLDELKEVERDAKEFVKYEVKKSMNYLLCNKKDENQNQPKIPNIYYKWEKLISDNFCSQFVGCISNIFPYEIGKIEINMKAKDILRFKFYTTYFTKQELINLSAQNKPFIYENLSRDSLILNKNTTNKEENELRLDFTILKEKKNIKHLMEYLSEQLKEKKIVIIENRDILSKYEVKNTLNRYYIFGKDKKKILRTQISPVEIGLDEINNCYLPENMHILIEDNQVTNFLNINRLKDEFKFFENNDVQLHLKLVGFKDI